MQETWLFDDEGNRHELQDICEENNITKDDFLQMFMDYLENEEEK